MKLRLEKGIIKIRLASSEIEKFYTNEVLTETIQISDENQFSYSIIINNSSTTCSASFSQHFLEVSIPQNKAEKWKTSKQIGIRETIVTNKGEEIVLTLEEDLPPRKHKKKH